ncbi:MAG: transcription elongation factor GreA [Bacilli bacterium]|nr:transcription elongation factor GreA [Bacilli bacterium]
MSERKKVYLTQEGYDEIKEELDNLINVKRPENIIAIKEARALGDLSENADYDAARNEQAEIEARIKKLEAIVDNVEIIEEVTTDKVGLGNTVKISYVDDEDDEDEYKIVGSQEADPFESKISNESPIAKALMGHKVGDVVSVESPNGSYEIKIVEIG